MRERVAAPFWNGETRRTRLPWRILALFVVLALLGLATGILVVLVRGSVQGAVDVLTPGGQGASALDNVLFVGTQVVVLVGSVFLVGRFVDRRRFRDFGLHVDRDWWADLGFGLVLGAALMTAVFLVELAAGWVTVTDTLRIDQRTYSFWPWFAWALVTFVVVGVTEELLARGYLLKNLAEGFTWFDRVGRGGAVALAVVCSSLVFAGGHAVNPNAGLESTAGILVASFMLAAGFVLTGELAIPVGVHVTWNFFQGPVFGFPVSGIDFGVSALAIEQRGPGLATGGQFGPEAGLLGVAASLVGIVLIGAWVRWRYGALRIHPSLTTPERRG